MYPTVREEGRLPATPDRRERGQTLLLTVQPNTNNLFRIDIESREGIRIDLGGETLTGGDGILLDSQIL